MIICLLGGTFSGKTTLENKLVDEFKFQHLKLYTTREKRNNETDRVSISKRLFEKLVKKGKFAHYFSWVDNNYYGFLKKDLNSAKNGLWVINLDCDPDELSQFNFQIIFLHANQNEIQKRYFRDIRYSKEIFNKRLTVHKTYLKNLRRLPHKLDTSTNVIVTFKLLKPLIKKLITQAYKK